MQIITDLENTDIPKSAVAIGKFDGIHKGHRQLLGKIIEKKTKGMKAVVFTFHPSPSVFFSGKPEKELTSCEEKRKIFEDMGVDILIEFPLTGKTASITKEQFVKDILSEKLHTGYLAAGSDLSFGKNGEGNSEFLQKESKKYGFFVEIIDKITYKGDIISSTLIRKAILEGDVRKANMLLDNPYCIEGTVKKGRQIGRTIGFPTVNILPPAKKLLPPNGVYKTEVTVGDRIYEAITNVGSKPTVTDSGQVFIESYLYQFSENIYGEKIQVRFLEFMRKEQKFKNIEELKAQLQKDMQSGQKINVEV